MVITEVVSSLALSGKNNFHFSITGRFLSYFLSASIGFAIE